MQKQNDVKFIVIITVKLLVISAITALLLSCVNTLTAERIAQNTANEKAAAIQTIFPNAVSNQAIAPTPEEMSAIYVVFSDEGKIGYAAELSPLGFGGKMTVMVGINLDKSVAGVKLISHSETPGLGTRVGEDSHLSQYTGKDSDAISQGIDVITGSTISSNAIRDAVVTALTVCDMIFEAPAAEVPNE